MNGKFNVIIPVAFKDYGFLARTIKYVEQNICPQKIIVLTDRRMQKFMPKDIRHNRKVKIEDENCLIQGLSFSSVRKALEMHKAPVGRTGWYLQQFLKMGYAKSSLCDTEYYLSWDADTIPLRNLNFVNGGGKPLFTIKKERNQPYFDTLTKLFHFTQEAPYSYIAEHMLFKKSVMQELLAEIEANETLQGSNWIEKIINATDSNELNAFSEFETYGTYCLNRYPELYETRTLNTFRKAGYIAGRFIPDKKLHYMAFDLDTASFELGDYPCGFEKYICYAYGKWLVMKQCIIKQFFIRDDIKSISQSTTEQMVHDNHKI